MKNKKLQELSAINAAFYDYPPFGGRAALHNRVRGIIDFLSVHKTDPKLEDLLLKEARGVQAEALRKIEAIAPRASETKGA